MRTADASNSDRGPGARHRAFTIVEMLVSVGIVALLIGLLVSVLAPARDHAATTRALSTGRQLLASTLMYAGDHDDGLPCFGARGDPYEPVTFFGWRPIHPQGYFRANEWHWASLVVPDYFDAPPGVAIAALTSDDMLPAAGGEPPPDRLFRSSFLMTDTAFAAPAYWKTDEPSEDLSLIRGTRTSEIAFPSLKGIVMEFGEIGFVDPSHSSRRDPDIGSLRVLAVTGDGAAALRPFATRPTVEQAAVSRPFGCWSTYLFATRDGLRGRDW